MFTSLDSRSARKFPAIKMEKMTMCRICLGQNVRMYVVVNKNLHELYEKLTYIPFVTEDSRPLLACFLCCTKLKQCYRFMRTCLEAEDLFAQMLNADNERYPLINPGRLHFFNGFSNSPTELFSIVDGGQTGSDAIKEELPDVVSDPEEEHQTDNVEDTPARHAESSLSIIPLMEIKIEFEDSTGPPVAKNPKLDTQIPKPSETISAEQKDYENNRKMSSVSKIIKKAQNHTTKRITQLKEPITKFKQPITKFKEPITKFKEPITTFKEPITTFKQPITTFKQPITKFKEPITKFKEPITKFKEHITKTQHGINSRVNDTVEGTSIRYNSDKDICTISKKGPDSDDRNRHGREFGTEKGFKCDVCQRSFSKNSDLIRHIRTHTGEKPYKCDICQRSFNLNYHLTIHNRIHTGEKPFKCEICQRNFRHKSYLTCHTRTHTGEKPFKCDICQSSFNQKIHLTTHIRTHTGEKPFKCDICQRSFTKKSDVVSHSRTHTGEKPFKCVICQRGFSKKRILVSHIHTHAAENPFKTEQNTA